jgi:hypothetical protein
MTRDDVRAYYQGFGDREWTRLDTAEGSVEFALSVHVIASYLPPGARMLDMGGCPRRAPARVSPAADRRGRGR